MKKIALFDVDDVIIKGQTQKLLLRFFLKKRKIRFLFFLKIYLWFILYKLKLIKNAIEIRKEAYKLITGWDEAETKKLFKEFFENDIKPRIFTQGVDIIRGHVNEGYEVILASASISEIVEELKNYLSLKFAIAARLEVIDSKYTGKILEPIPYGVNKSREVENFAKNNDFTLNGSYAYTDHLSDLSLLELVTIPVVVNPDRQLRKIANQRKWACYDFR